MQFQQVSMEDYKQRVYLFLGPQTLLLVVRLVMEVYVYCRTKRIQSYANGIEFFQIIWIMIGTIYQSVSLIDQYMETHEEWKRFIFGCSATVDMTLTIICWWFFFAIFKRIVSPNIGIIQQRKYCEPGMILAFLFYVEQSQPSIRGNIFTAVLQPFCTTLRYGHRRSSRI